jgi:acetyl-CoA carboxylase carboxyltransferase component
MDSSVAVAAGSRSGDAANGATPRRRLDLLCDPGSFRSIRSAALSPRLGARARPGDGVVAGVGRIDGRPVACYAQDASMLGGSLGVAQSDTIERVMCLAERSRMPIVGFVESAGARLHEGTAALGGYGRIFRRSVALSGVVPQISIVAGLAAGGACYSPSLTDFVVMTAEATMFLTGPRVVREVAGEQVGVAELGGARIHERNGVCDAVATDEPSAVRLARTLLGYLPQHADAEPPGAMAADPTRPDPALCLPGSPRDVYDVRDVIEAMVDADSLLELGPRWARSLFTGMARCEGRPIGLIASQPRYMGGVLDAASAQKGARFVETCNAFGLPLLVLVDTPGFMPGRRQEQAGVIRFGAGLVRAFAAATVPRVTVILRKAYGGAYITMNCKDLGADLVFAWPEAEIGVMGAEAASAIIDHRALRAAVDPVAEREALAKAYAAEHLSAEAAAAQGFVDEVIEPGQTRERLIWALATLTDGHGSGRPPRR